MKMIRTEKRLKRWRKEREERERVEGREVKLAADGAVVQ